MIAISVKVGKINSAIAIDTGKNHMLQAKKRPYFASDLKPSAKRIGRLTAFFLIFGTPLYLRDRDYSEKSIDAQVFLKLALWALAITFALTCTKLFLAMLKSSPSIGWLCFFFILLASIPFSVQPQLSAGYVVAAATCFWSSSFIGFAFERDEIIRISLKTIAWICAISLIYHTSMLGIPGLDFGGGPEGRVKGIVQHPQMLGMISGYGLLLCYLFRARLKMIGLVTALMVVVLAITLIASGSRTPLLAIAIAVSFGWVCRLGFIRSVHLIAVLVSIILVIITTDVNMDVIVGSISRTSSPEEVLTLNNRTLIWSYVPQLIMERPFLGWGYGTIAQFLPEHAFGMGFTPGYEPANTQNQVLEIALAAGIPAAIVAVGSYLFLILRATKTDQAWIGIVAVYQLVVGATEPIPFKDTPGFDLVMLGLLSGALSRTSSNIISAANKARPLLPLKTHKCASLR